MNLIDKISQDLNIPKEMLNEALFFSRNLVKLLRITKKDGGERKVFQPSKKLKVIQYWLIKNVFSIMKVHKSAMAYKENISIKNNAVKHSKNKYFLKLDFKDYFPSIMFEDFLPYLESWHEKAKPVWNLNKEAIWVIKDSCFYKEDRLPIGYPSSPIISNIVMYNFDVEVTSMLSDHIERFGRVEYTRYADDMVFSTNKKGACKEILKNATDLIENIKTPKLKINSKKINFVSSSGGSALVTGLRICHDGHITLHRNYKDKIRLLISLFSKERLKNEDISRLKGHIAYVKNVDSVFYTKLQHKYFKTLDKLNSIF